MATLCKDKCALFYWTCKRFPDGSRRCYCQRSKSYIREDEEICKDCFDKEVYAKHIDPHRK